jgi:hypothetical protein
VAAAVPAPAASAGTFQPAVPAPSPAAVPAGTFQPGALAPGLPQPQALDPGMIRQPGAPVAPPAPRAAASFQPGGTMMPDGGASAIPDLSGSIAGSAIALKASIQEEALAELAGINAYKPERTESKPASSLARRQTGQTALPAPAAAPATPPKARDAEKIRSALSSFQLGTRRGRSDARSTAGKG